LIQDIIITMVPKGPHVKDVFMNEETGLLSIGKTSRSILFMECSTIDVTTSLEVRKAATELGHRFVDAPVSGGVNGAYQASLTFMIGGSSELFADVLPVAKAMGKEENIYHCGGAGAGLATKQINNYLSACCIIATSEAFNTGIRYGLDPKTLANVINVSTGMNYNSSFQNPIKGVTSTSAASKDFEGGFSIELCKGVVEMAVDLGKQVGAKSLLSDIVVDSLTAAAEDPRCKGKDCRSFYRWLADV
jgi:3-hydroxyisobutyrate/3-hydroxypropionate dehydrogenase